MARPLSPSPLWKAWQRTLAAVGHPVLIQAETEQHFSAGELNEHASGIALRLRPATGAWVAFSMKNEAEWLSLFLACQAVGAAAMPLDSHLPEQALASTARDLGAHYLWQKGNLTRLARPPATGSKTACIKTTSGTTGKMQAIPCLSGHLVADGENIIATMKIRSSDRNLGLIPLGHSYGLGNLLMPLILQGSPIVCAREFVPSQIPAWISRYRVTVFPSVPGILRVLSQLPGKNSLKPLRTVISAGAPLSAETARVFSEKFHLKIHNFYGSSETGGISYDRTGTASLQGRSVGKPLQGVALSLSDSGRIQVAGAAVAMPKKRHVLPDLGKWNRYGELTLLGRARSVANIGGRKVAPAEIEEALRDFPGVSETWTTVIHLNGRDYLAAAVESSLSRKEIQERLHRRLPSWKIPRFLRVSPALPRTSRGKLDREALRALFPG